MNFFIRVDELVAEFKSKCGVVKKDSKIISLVGINLTGDHYTQFTNFVSAYEDQELDWNNIKCK